MLRLAAENAPGAAFHQVDVREPLPGGPFGAAISLFDSVNHFSSNEELVAVFRNVFEALEPGGLFLFDVNTAEGFEEAAAETYADVEAKRVCVVKTHFGAELGRGASDVTLFSMKEDGWRRRDFQIEEYLHAESDIDRILRDVGFSGVEVLAADDDLGMHRGYGRLFFLATKG
jgi:SAM-dependent methyltransferase